MRQRDGTSSSVRVFRGAEQSRADPPGLCHVPEVTPLGPRSRRSDGDVADGAAPRNRTGGWNGERGVLCAGRGAGWIPAGSTGLGSSFPSLRFISRVLFLPVGIPKSRRFLASVLLACVFLSPRGGKIPFCSSLPRPSTSLDISAGETGAQRCWDRGWAEGAARSVMSPATKIAFSWGKKKPNFSTGRARSPYGLGQRAPGSSNIEAMLSSKRPAGGLLGAGGGDD